MQKTLQSLFASLISSGKVVLQACLNEHRRKYSPEFSQFDYLVRRQFAGIFYWILIVSVQCKLTT